MNKLLPINIDDFKPSASRECNDGVQIMFRFDNNYGASVVKHSFSYGGKRGLYELAVIRYGVKNNDDFDFEIVYDTSITSDVIGYLEPKEILPILIDIKGLS